MNYFYVPCENFEEIIVLQEAYYSLKDNEIPNKKIIYSVSVKLNLDYDYEIDLFMQNYKGMDNAIYLYKINLDKGFISFDDLLSHKKGILVGFCLNGGEIENPLPENNNIIDFVYGIDYSKVDEFKKKLPNYKVFAWPDKLEFDKLKVEEII